MEAKQLSQLGLPLCGAFSPAPAGPREEGAAKDAAEVALPNGSSHAAAALVGPEARALAEAMRRPLPLRSPAHEVSVVSFNMLLKGFDKKPYYPGVPAALREWGWRKQQLQNLLFGLSADIFCMQEVECSTFSEEFAFLAAGGYAFVAPKDDSKGKFPDMAKPAIFYKADRFEKLWEEQRSRIVLAAFRHRSSERTLYVASCHLEGAPWEAAKRFAQAKKALDSLRKQMLKDHKERGVAPADCGLVFAGDFNETEDAAVSYCLRSGGLPSSFRDPRLPEEELTKQDYVHDFEMEDLYAREGSRHATFCAPAEESAAWGSTPTFAAVDFIFHSANLRPTSVRLPFTDAQLRATAGVGIPSAWHFSDHVPLGGVFEFASEEDCCSGAAASWC